MVLKIIGTGFVCELSSLPFGFSLNQIYLCIAAFLPSTGIFLGSVTALVGTMISIIAMEVLFIRN